MGCLHTLGVFMSPPRIADVGEKACGSLAACIFYIFGKAGDQLA
jgi:hypothetical protein